jgi:hypothetical protein
MRTKIDIKIKSNQIIRDEIKKKSIKKSIRKKNNKKNKDQI